ncbi:hypothetical protein GLOTRDRAFT_141244 [Gloeophyllum trabeum ATCC 11539]|uniref:RBR-type E3 ubiquitin transferase n=1 Tax=Gloeophyllum trabeum (strain ATCC 11539 / FP-39264 / Madison 617) TaxID=670483 RepID=S7PUP2_GLOTA|nr:uncharacterized protein GLOTRDRAFT_141244 [Gloeophyllum trabeum ATCC 11539]EPQ51128.1 hypothetical protein GLOTRDRAFT_141244 [Gloeophyllum trabeum ATCC 11539]
MTSTSVITQTRELAVFEDEGDNNDFMSLVISLQLEDLEAMEATDKGKARDDSGLGDTVYSIYRAELEAMRRCLEDQKIAQSMDAALDADAGILEEVLREEAIARRDHELAVALSQGREIPQEEPQPQPAAKPPGEGYRPSATSTRTPTPVQQPKTKEVSEHSISPRSQTSSSDGQGTSIASSSRIITAVQNIIKFECVICMTSVGSDQAVKVPCGHHYDFDCLVELFLQATKDESLMPARCCKQPIPLDLARPHLTSQQALEYRAKEIEHDTPNRLYCPRATCSAFLGAAGGAGTVTCYRCAVRVCKECKALEHPLGECRPDFGDETMLELARREGYQRCPVCHRFTELAHGCYHMTCVCRAQFCYLCGARWKTCKCREWDEERLLDRAQAQVRAEFGRPAQAAQVPLFRQRVAQAVDYLRDNHDCSHPRWRYRAGGDNCEECGHYLPQFLLRVFGAPGTVSKTAVTWM